MAKGSRSSTKKFSVKRKLRWNSQIKGRWYIASEFGMCVRDGFKTRTAAEAYRAELEEQ